MKRYAKTQSVVRPDDYWAMLPEQREQFNEDLLAWKENRLSSFTLSDDDWQEMWETMAGTQFCIWLCLKIRKGLQE